MKKNLVKWVLAVVLVGAAVGSFVAYKMWNKEHADATEAEGIKVDAQSLLKAFQTNETAANATYIGKVVEVSGEIGEITSDSTPKIILSVPDEMMEGIVVSIDKRHAEDVARLKSGDKAVFKGFCSGYLELSGVIINDAVLMQ